jgi:hypothetical protein
MSQFPHQIGTRVSDEVRSQMEKIHREFGLVGGTVARMAIEDYCPRFIAARGKPKASEFLTKLAPVLEEHPELAAEIDRLVKAHRRNRRIAA